MSAAAASTSQPVQGTSAAVEHAKDDDVPHLGVLEEDDEFEEFAVAGTLALHAPCSTHANLRLTDRLGRLTNGPRSSGRDGTGGGEVGRGQAVGGQLGRRRHRR